MLHRVLASKKNVILLVIAVVVAFMVTSYYLKQQRLYKMVLLGGQVELVQQSVPVNKTEFGLIRKNSSRVAVATDMKTYLPLPIGETLVNVRSANNNYPLRGTMNIKREQFQVVFSADKAKKLFGVAVNDKFMRLSGMQIGDTFTMGTNTYQIRGIVKSLPDDSGKIMMDEPFMLLRDWQMGGSGMYVYAQQREIRYMINTKKGMSAKKWVNAYKRRFPRSGVTIKRWDA